MDFIFQKYLYQLTYKVKIPQKITKPWQFLLCVWWFSSILQCLSCAILSDAWTRDSPLLTVILSLDLHLLTKCWKHFSTDLNFTIDYFVLCWISSVSCQYMVGPKRLLTVPTKWNTAILISKKEIRIRFHSHRTIFSFFSTKVFLQQIIIFCFQETHLKRKSNSRWLHFCFFLNIPWYYLNILHNKLCFFTFLVFKGSLDNSQSITHWAPHLIF